MTTRDFDVSAPTLARVALLAAAVIAALSFRVVTPGFARTGHKSPTKVARRRLGCEPPSEPAGGADRMSGPLGVVAERMWVKVGVLRRDVEEPSEVRLGADLDFAETGRIDPFGICCADCGRRGMNCFYISTCSTHRSTNRLTGKPNDSAAV